MSGFIYSLDYAIGDWLNKTLAHPVLDVVFKVITSLGDAGWFWIVLSVILLCFKKTRRYGVSMALNPGLTVEDLDMLLG